MRIYRLLRTLSQHWERVALSRRVRVNHKATHSPGLRNAPLRWNTKYYLKLPDGSSSIDNQPRLSAITTACVRSLTASLRKIDVT
jgi:hypothetical protein